MRLSIVETLPINKILLIIFPLGHFGITAMEWVLLGGGIRLWRQSPSLAMIVLPLLLASLSYDNFILAIGNLIGEGELLKSLSMVRFLLHDLVVPLFIVIGVELAYRAGAAWTTTVVRVLSWVIAFGLAGIDVTTKYIELELVPTYFAGILRYTAANVSGPPIITIIVNLFMLVIGIGIWIRLKWSWLFVGTLIALLANAIPSSILGTLPGSASELGMALSLLLTEQQVQIVRKQPDQNKKQEDKFMVDSTISEIALEWKLISKKDGYAIYQSGSHKQGNFIQVFAPDTPYRDAEGKLKLITYLHGFALCLPKFYEAHLEDLAKRGYYVFFPDFQQSDYPDEIESEKLYKANKEKPHLRVWFSELYNTVKDVNSKRNRFQFEGFDSNQQKKSRKVPKIKGKLPQPNRFQHLRVCLALVVFIVFVKFIYSWFNRKYGKHLINMISSVAWSLRHQPSDWIENAIALTEQAWQKLCDDNAALAQEKIDFYVFGHSLGGLLALSWPAYHCNSKTSQNFFPKQVITADPAPNTEMGIPLIAIWILKLFKVPFAEAPITIAQTGSKLNIPVGIMHGADDKIVKPESWIKPSLFKKQANVDYIVSQQKKIYFSLSNNEPSKPPLVAFHNQAVTDTTYYDDALFDNFGGVKEEPNDYNFQYIWAGLNLVVEDQVRADELLDKFPLRTIEVTDTLSPNPSLLKAIAILMAVLALLGLGYWLWHFEIVFSQ